MSFQYNQPAPSESTEPGRLFLVSAHRKLLTEIVDSLMRGTQFLALTGASGLGKTTMAAAIHEELNKQSVPVGWIDDCYGTGIHLRTIMSQFLGKPEAEIDADDVERLFNAMTGQGSSQARLVLIIDDAECLRSDAIAYLRLLVSVTPECMPQIVFIGSPSFLEIADQLTEPGFKDLTTARFVLEPLNSTQISDAAEQFIPAPRDAAGSGFSPAATTTDSDPSPGRATVAEVAAQLETGIATPVIDGLARRGDLNIKVTTHNVPALLPKPIIPRQNKSLVRIVSAALVVGTIGAAAYWLASFGIDRTLPARQTVAFAIAQVKPAVSTIQVRLPFSSSALQAQSDVLNFNSARMFSAATLTPQSGNPGAPATRQILPRVRLIPARAETVLPLKSPGHYLSPPTHGTWLFPPNASGGG